MQHARSSCHHFGRPTSVLPARSNIQRRRRDDARLHLMPLPAGFPEVALTGDPKSLTVFQVPTAYIIKR